MLKKGDEVPDVTLPGTEGETNLREVSGDGVAVLYFYPEALTSGCTKEAQSFRDAMRGFRERDVQVYGISRDPMEKVERFRDEHDLDFPLLSDGDGEAIKAFGVEGRGGRAKRVTFVTRDGEVSRVFGDVSPEGHADEVLGELDEAAGPE